MNKKRLSLGIGGAVIVLFFLFYFFSIGNYEFIGYAVVVSLLIGLLIYSDKFIDYPPVVLWFFLGWIFLHFSGGAFSINGIRLYDYILIDLVGDPFNILKYDQAIHAYCYFAIAMIAYFVAKKQFKKMNFVSYILVVLIAFGVSGLNEIIEFGMVIWLDAGEAVGGYYNTMMDMVTNLFGASFGVLFARKLLDRK